jgi:hypothetical protein
LFWFTSDRFVAGATVSECCFGSTQSFLLSAFLVGLTGIARHSSKIKPVRLKES